MNDTLRITRLEAQDFRRLQFIDIAPKNRGLVLLKGPNGAGKTSILDCIIAALQGKRHAPTLAIREGLQHAIVKLTLSDRLTDRYKVTAKWRKQKNGAEYQTLTITDLTTDPPTQIKKPQTFLDGQLIGDLSFDPLKFARETDRTKRTKMLRTAAGIEDAWGSATTQIDRLYKQRAQSNANKRAVEIAMEGLPHPVPGIPNQRVDLKNLSDTLQNAIRSNTTLVKAQQDHRNAEGNATRIRAHLAELTTELAEAEAKTKTIAAEIADGTEIDTTPLTAAIESAGKTNADVEDAAKRNALKNQLDLASTTADQLDTSLTAARADRQALLTASNLAKNIPGLSIDQDGEIEIDSIPLDGCSGTQRLTLSAEIAMLANPCLRAMTIDEADSLDPDSMETLQALAIRHDYDIYMTVTWATAPDGANTIQIRDGLVAEDDPQNAAAASKPLTQPDRPRIEL